MRKIKIVNNIRFKKIISFTALFLVITVCVLAQNHPYQTEINKFKEEDKKQLPPENAILFVGSSSFRLWDNLESYFPSNIIINRGFGGSEIPDVMRYADDIIFPYNPKQVVIYCGENDVASTGSASVVFDRFTKLFELIRSKMPHVSIVYVSMKPSPSRKKFFPEMQKANALIRKYLQGKTEAVFVDVYNPMLTPEGKPMSRLFKEDSLHMNASGYAIWKEAIEPHLKK